MFQQAELSTIKSIVAQQQQKPDLPDINIEQLLSSNIFGQISIKKPVKITATPTKSAIKIKSHIKLLGTVVAQDRSVAIIKPDTTASESVFFVGDKILPHVTLIAIEATSIMISDNNQHKKIELTNNQNAAKTLSNTNTLTKNINFLSPFSSAAHQSALKSNHSKNSFFNMIALSGLAPQTKAGQFLGIAVNSVIPNSLFYKAGLKKGDLIQSINGYVLKNRADIRKAYDNGKQSGYLNIVFVRDKQSLTAYQLTR